MASGAEHYLEAERLVRLYEDAGDEWTKDWGMYTLTAAQVHATLALAAATICAGNARTEIHGDGATYADVAQGADWAEVLS